MFVTALYEHCIFTVQLLRYLRFKFFKEWPQLLYLFFLLFRSSITKYSLIYLGYNHLSTLQISTCAEKAHNFILFYFFLHILHDESKVVFVFFT